jgi:hypothetical protein
MLGLAFFHGEQIFRFLFLILFGGIVVLTVVSALLVKFLKGRLGNRAYWFAPIPFVVAAGSLYFWYWTQQPITGPLNVLVGADAVRFIKSKIGGGFDFGYWGLAFFKGKLYVSTNLGLLEIESGNISKLYRFQRRYSVVSGPWPDAADKLLWVEDEQTAGLASFDGVKWTRVPMPSGLSPNPGSLPQFTGNAEGFWAVVGGNVWRWDSARAAGAPENIPKPASPGEGVIGVMPLGGQLLFIERHELLPFLVRPNEEFKSDTVVVLDGSWREVRSKPGLRFMVDSSTVADDAGYICTTTGDLLRVTTEQVTKLDTPGECEALASVSGKLVAGFRRKGIYEYQGDKWYLRAAHPYPSGEGKYWSHLAGDGAQLSYAITGKPVVDRTASSGRDMKFTRTAPRALWVLLGPEFQQVIVERP